MSEKKYVLTRRADANPARTSFLYELIPAPDGVSDDQPVHVEEVDFYRAHPWVDDRTRPDWSHVPTGTAGTATVCGVKDVRVMRSAMTDLTWITSHSVDSRLAHADEHVSDFVADVVVTDELIERVADELGGLASLGLDSVADRVEAILRGES